MKQLLVTLIVFAVSWTAASAAALMEKLSYLCAVEYEGKLYVGFSNNGGRRGNLNSAELAVIPIKQLAVE